MSFQTALEAWVRANAAYAIPADAVELSDFDVKHEEGFGNDNGTWFPADITITFNAKVPKTKGNKEGFTTKKCSCGPPTDDIVEFMRELTDMEV